MCMYPYIDLRISLLSIKISRNVYSDIRHTKALLPNRGNL